MLVLNNYNSSTSVVRLACANAKRCGECGAIAGSGALAAGGRHEGQDGGEDATIDVHRRRARLTLFIHIACYILHTNIIMRTKCVRTLKFRIQYFLLYMHMTIT